MCPIRGHGPNYGNDDGGVQRRSGMNDLLLSSHARKRHDGDGRVDEWQLHLGDAEQRGALGEHDDEGSTEKRIRGCRGRSLDKCRMHDDDDDDDDDDDIEHNNNAYMVLPISWDVAPCSHRGRGNLVTLEWRPNCVAEFRSRGHMYQSAATPDREVCTKLSIQLPSACPLGATMKALAKVRCQSWITVDVSPLPEGFCTLLRASSISS
nr:hypothetical protein CFP56_01258 [Quercus suber]